MIKNEKIVGSFDGNYAPTSFLCVDCKWYISGHACKAYPNGIPVELWNYPLHIKPYKGDHGLQYVDALEND